MWLMGTLLKTKIKVISHDTHLHKFVCLFLHVKSFYKVDDKSRMNQKESMLDLPVEVSMKSLLIVAS